MPEGDTLRVLADRIQRTRVGARVTACHLRHPRIAGVDLVGTTMTSCDAYGKHLFIRFDESTTLHCHLLMTGRWMFDRADTMPAWRRRIDLHTDRGPIVGVDIPIAEFIPTRHERLITARLGPDLCARSGPPDPTVITARLRETPDTALTAALLDQRRVAGFGNVYAVDLPFLSGVHPTTPVGDIDGLQHLVTSGIGLIRENARRGPQNTLGRDMDRSAAWVQGRRGQLCRHCGDRLVGRDDDDVEWGRIVTFCATCQPLTATTVDVDRIRALGGSHPGIAFT